jgi:monoamine oxidase
MHVVVVGAGVAGLRCADGLLRAGHDVTILEGQDRVGGRVQTIRDPFSDGLYSEAGALFIPESHALTQRCLGKLQLAVVAIPPSRGGMAFSVRGQRLVVRPGVPPQWPLDLNATERGLTLRKLAALYVGPRDSAGVETFAQYLRRRGASPDAIELLGMGQLGIWGDGPHSCLAAVVLRDAAAPPGKVCRIAGGNDLLPKALSARLAKPVRTGCRVVRITRSEHKLRVTFVRAGRHHCVEADRLVLAVPFSTLRRMFIDPPFSDGKMRAIAQLPYTSVTRVFLQFRERFWLSAGLSGTGAVDAPRMRVREVGFGCRGQRGILECYFSGPEARRVMDASAPDPVGRTLALVERIYPGASARFERGVCKSWDRDEWALGAYSYYKPGQAVAIHAHVAAAEGRVHFAGDHTSEQPGWLEGALQSGDRVVREAEM